LKWPHDTIRVLGQAIWERGVDVEIVVSNPGSIPGGLSPLEACYGNGWSCADVAAEIIKSIREQFPESVNFAPPVTNNEEEETELNDETENKKNYDNKKNQNKKQINKHDAIICTVLSEHHVTGASMLQKRLENNLRVCYLRHKDGTDWEDGTSMGLHSKHFIIDDVATYIGSQNLYVCDLAEWGVVIDNVEATTRFLEEYWTPMWRYAHQDGGDFALQEVMEGLEVDRDGDASTDATANLDEDTRTRIQDLKHSQTGANRHGKFYETTTSDV